MRVIKKGATSQSIYVEILDSTSTTGGRLTGLAYNTASLTAYYVRNGGSATQITLATLAAANSAYSSGGFKEVDATNMPGVYRLDVPDAALASGADSVVITLKGATGMVQVSLEVQLVAWDPQDSVRGGMTALPNAAAEASGGLPTLSAAQASNGTINVNVHRWLTGTPNALQSGRVDSYVGAMASGVIAAGTFAANALDAVWSTTTRLLTAGTNIVLAKGTGVTGFNDLSAAQVNAEVDTALADYDGPTHAEMTAELATADDAVLAAIAALNNLSAAQVNAEVDTALADYDGPTHAELVSEIDSVQTDIDALPTNAELATALASADDATLAAIAALSIPTAAAIADAVHDEVIDGTRTQRQLLRGFAAVLLGKVSGMDTFAPVFRDIGDTKDVVSASTDNDGNRDSVTLDLT